ncbi:MAG: GspH/FimT family pseudopilin [Acetobacteraceae bacterium]
MPPRPPAASGFTLIELLVVLTIMGLLAALVPLALSAGRARIALGTTAAEIAAELRTARLGAMESGHNTIFIANPASGRFGLAGRKLRRLPRDVSMRLLTIAGQRLGPDAGFIRFFPDGSTSGGAIRLRRGRAWRVLRIDWFTGRVSIRAGASP